MYWILWVLVGAVCAAVARDGRLAIECGYAAEEMDDATLGAYIRRRIGERDRTFIEIFFPVLAIGFGAVFLFFEYSEAILSLFAGL